MGYFAKLNENNIVTEVHSVSNFVFETNGIDDENKGIEYLTMIFNYSNWKQTSYNTMGGIHFQNGEPSPDQTKAFRKNYARIGDTYDAGRDAFIPPKPFPSWVLHEASCLWEAPIPIPITNKPYIWNEDRQTWDIVIWNEDTQLWDICKFGM